MVTSIAASSLSSSISSRAGEPGPTAAKLTAPGLDLASLTSSPTVLDPSFGPTTRTSGPRAGSDMGAKSAGGAEGAPGAGEGWGGEGGGGVGGEGWRKDRVGGVACQPPGPGCPLGAGPPPGPR